MIERAALLISNIRSEVMVRLIPAKYWDAITISAFAHNALYRSVNHNNRVFHWEEDAITRYFPSPPAKILVTAAGGGRELRYLACRGYQVAGFEPALPLLDFATSLIPKERCLALEAASYDDFLDRIPAIERHSPYDAAVIGWASIAHIHTEDERTRILDKVRELCPNGPVLISWLGDRAARNRSRHDGAAKYSPQHGFVRLLDIGTINALLSEYEIAFVDERSYPHAIVIPR